MKSSLLQHADPALHEELRTDYRAAKLLREVLCKELKRKINSSRKEQIANNYDAPCWAQYQADQNGYQRALEEAISLLTEK